MMLYYIILNYYIILYIYYLHICRYCILLISTYYILCILCILCICTYRHAHAHPYSPVCLSVSLRERTSTILSHDQQRIAAELSACRAPCQSFFVQDFECHNGSPSLGAFGHGQCGNISCFCIVSTVQ